MNSEILFRLSARVSQAPVKCAPDKQIPQVSTVIITIVFRSRLFTSAFKQVVQRHVVLANFFMLVLLASDKKSDNFGP